MADHMTSAPDERAFEDLLDMLYNEGRIDAEYGVASRSVASTNMRARVLAAYRAALAERDAMQERADDFEAERNSLLALLRAGDAREVTLTAQLNAALADAKRLDWWEVNPGRITPEAAVDPAWNSEGYHDEEDGWADSETRLWYPSLRAAIDAALAAEAPHA